MNETLDMARFIEAKSDQLNSDDLVGSPRTITITRVTGQDGDQPVSIHFIGDNGKPFKPCKTIRRVLVGVWGRYANEYVGRSMTLYRDDSVTFGGLATGGIRISHMSHIDKEMIVVVMKSKGKKAGIKILPLIMDRGYSIEDARDDMRLATTTDELKSVWQNKAMAPHREALSDFLTECKEAIADSEAKTSRSDAEHGDQSDGVTDGDGI